EPVLVVTDRDQGTRPIDLPLAVLFGTAPRMVRRTERRRRNGDAFTIADLDVAEAARRVLRFPAVASKSFLITIGDRTVGGLVARDQLVGPHQVPVADAAVSLADFTGYAGEAMALGERTPVAVLDSAASARLAVGEALTNLLSAPVERLEHVRLSANWMAAAGFPGEDAALYDAVRAIALELCPALGVSIPVGKDSLSMRTLWEEGKKRVVAPLSLVITAFSRIADARKTLTPELRRDAGETALVLIDLGSGKNRLGGSVLAQVHGAIGKEPPDVDDPALLKALFGAMAALRENDLVLAYHDRSDGGLFATSREMAFAGGTGVRVRLDALGADPVSALFTEELGAVLQVRAPDVPRVLSVLEAHGLSRAHCPVIGAPSDDDALTFEAQGRSVFSAP